MKDFLPHLTCMLSYSGTGFAVSFAWYVDVFGETKFESLQETKTAYQILNLLHVHTQHPFFLQCFSKTLSAL